MLSRGQQYEHHKLEPSFERLIEANVCVWPTESQVSELVRFVRSRDLELVSIGCGEGLLEGLCQKAGVATTAVDLDFKADKSYNTTRCFCSAIHRVPPRSLFAIPRPERTCLLVCFGKRVPLLSYLTHFPTIPAVVLIGDHSKSGVCSPSCDLLSITPEYCDAWSVTWRLPFSAVMEVEAVGYERLPCCTQPGSNSHGTVAELTEVDIDAI